MNQYLKENSVDGFVNMSTCKECMKMFSLSLKEVEKTALHVNLTPLRYKRNQTSISIEDQLKLSNSKVIIIGCGGLGGFVAEYLSRIGLGEITLFDFDEFDETNINRQNFSNYENIGEKKVLVVAEEIKKINPALHVEAICKKFDIKEDFEYIKKADVVVDALDNPQLKLELASTCKEKNIDFVHASIAGFSSQISTCNTLENTYKNGESGIENRVGNLVFTASFTASLQSAEVVKLLLKKGEVFKDKIFVSDLLDNDFTSIGID